jgi:hypothetical protein
MHYIFGRKSRREASWEIKGQTGEYYKTDVREKYGSEYWILLSEIEPSGRLQ